MKALEWLGTMDRMDWGLGNPNSTAAMVVGLTGLAWLGAWRFRRGFWFALAATLVLGACLMLTRSRGGMVAAAMSVGILLAWAPRPWPWWRVMACLAAFWIVLGIAVASHAAKRLEPGQMAADASIANRVQIWRSVPRMLVDAPGGWGFGRAGEAYTQWYMAPDSGLRYATLVNGHLQALAELSWPLRPLYAALWALAFCACWPGRNSPWRCAALATVAGFFSAAAFSSVTTSIWVWMAPAASVFVCGIDRWRRRELPQRVAAACGIGVGLVCLLHMAGWLAPDSRVRRAAGVTIVGSGQPNVWVFPDPRVMGRDYGKRFRACLAGSSGASRGAVAFIDEGAEVRPSGGLLVAAGNRTPGPINGGTRVRLLNPRFDPEACKAGRTLAADRKLELFFGEFCDSTARAAWERLTNVSVIEGAGEFLADWPRDLIPPGGGS